MTEAIFSIETTMEKADLRNFLYISTFRKKRFILTRLALFCLLGSLLIGWSNEFIAPISSLLTWAVLFILFIGIICLKIERIIRLRLKTDKTGSFGSTDNLKFYDEKIVIEKPSLNATCTFSYTQFFQLIESKNYFIFYVNINQATLLRKKDIENPNEFKEFILAKFNNRYRAV